VGFYSLLLFILKPELLLVEAVQDGFCAFHYVFIILLAVACLLTQDILNIPYPSSGFP
jgi:hypothetical protein